MKALYYKILQCYLVLCGRKAQTDACASCGDCPPMPLIPPEASPEQVLKEISKLLFFLLPLGFGANKKKSSLEPLWRKSCVPGIAGLTSAGSALHPGRNGAKRNGYPGSNPKSTCQASPDTSWLKILPLLIKRSRLSAALRPGWVGLRQANPRMFK